MSSKELQQPEVYLSVDGNKLSAAENTLGARSKGLVAEKLTQFLKIARQKPLLTAAGLLAIGYAGCNNVEQQNTPPPPTPTLAVSQMPEGLPSATIEFTKIPMSPIVEQQAPTTEAPTAPPTIEQQTPTATPELSETPTPAVPESKAIPITEIGLSEEVKHLRDEKRAIYSQLMDEMEASVPKDKRYFIKVGEKGVYQDRALIFTKPSEQNGEKVWIAMTRDGPKSFSLKDSFWPPDQIQLPSDYIEAFIKNSVEELRRGKNDFLPYKRAGLSEKWEESGSETHSLNIVEPSGFKNFFIFRPDPPLPHMVEEVMIKSQEAAGLRTRPPEQLAREKLERAKSLHEMLKPHLNPQQQPSQQPSPSTP